MLLELPPGRVTREVIEEAVRAAISAGLLAPGSSLPSTRELAAQLGVARGTVVAAVDQLAVEGLVQTRQGAATRVTTVPVVPTTVADRQPAPSAPPAADFSSGEPDLTRFPVRWWSAATRRVLTSRPADVLAYGDPRGQAALRRALAGYLRRTRGVVADPDNVVITAGFSHALAVIGRAIRTERRADLAVEDPSLRMHRHVLEAAGLVLVPVGVDHEGLRVGELPTGDRPSVLLTPANQTPFGVTLSPVRRNQLLAWAADHDGLVVEDDYDGELRYDRRPVPALHGRDPGRVLYCGSASKTLAPGLRLGWTVVPTGLVAPVTKVIESLGGTPVSSLDQLVLAELIESGRYDAHVRTARTAYRRRRDQLVAALAASVPQVRVSGVSAGLKALIRLPRGTDEAGVVSALAARSVAVMALDEFRVSASADGPGLVLNFGRPYAHQYRAALAHFTAALADVLASMRSPGGGQQR